MSYRTAELNKLNTEFAHAAALLLNGDSPTISQLEYVLDCYNSIVIYSEIDFEKKKKSTIEHIRAVIEANRITLHLCFDKLKLTFTLPGKLLSTIHYVPDNNPDHTHTDKHNKPNKETQTVVDTNETKMVQSINDFLKLASALINYKYEGDPLKLQSFLADVDLVVQSAEENNGALCLTFLKRCVSGRALEYIPEDADTVEKFKNALKNNIKTESSDVVEGKMMALHVRRGNFTEFTQEAEKLAEAFRRSLVLSGISHAKAQEMTIKKTIELCRKTARSEVVKSVISSSHYEQPADVLATLVTQNDVARKEKAESDAFKLKQQSKNSGSQNRNGRFNGRGGGRGNYNNNGGRGGNNNNNNFRQNNGNRDNHQRGNGNFRGNGQNRQYQNRGNRNEHTIRVLTGNSPGPSHGQMFYPQQQMLQQQQQQQPQQDQIFQIPY